MIPYLILVLFTIPLTRLFVQNTEKNNRRIRIAIILWLIVIVIVSGLRGDFTADSSNYQRIYMTFEKGGWSAFSSSFNLNYHFNVTEIGYVLINFFVGLFTDNFVWVQIIIAILSYVPIVIWCRQSVDIGLSLCLFLSIGTYIEGLNTVRNILAACIFVFAIKYIFKGDFKRYLLIVIIASTIHLSAFVMLPIYFVLRIKPTKFKLILYSLTMLLFVYAMEPLAILYNKYFLVSANNEGVLSLLHRRQANPVNVIVPVLLVIFVVYVFYRTSSHKELCDLKIRVLMNGTIIWGLLKVTMLFSEYTTRFACYFSPFILLTVPLMLERFAGRQRLVMSTLVYVIYVLYFLVVCRGYGDYYLFAR